MWITSRAFAVISYLCPNIHAAPPRDRKSTRLNSSHVETSYAVFCLKKKTICLALVAVLHLSSPHPLFGNCAAPSTPVLPPVLPRSLSPPLHSCVRSASLAST